MDNRDKHLSDEEFSMAERIKRAQADALEAKTYMDTLGIKPADMGEKAGQGESIQSQVVSTALNKMGDMVGEADKRLKETGEKLETARKESDDAKAMLMKEQMDGLKQVLGGLQASIKEIEVKNSPEAAIATFEKWRNILNQFPKEKEVVSAPPSAVSEQTTITLEKMRQEHELAIEKLRSDREQANNEFRLKMQQFEEERERRIAEYRDNLKFRDNAVNGFSDLAASIAAGIDRNRGVAPAAEEEIVQAAVSGFNCQMCGSHIDIPDGVDKVACPKKECGAMYDVKVKK